MRRRTIRPAASSLIADGDLRLLGSRPERRLALGPVAPSGVQIKERVTLQDFVTTLTWRF